MNYSITFRISDNFLLSTFRRATSTIGLVIFIKKYIKVKSGDEAMENKFRNELNNVTQESLNKTSKLANTLITVVWTCVYIGCLVYGTLKMQDPNYDLAQAKLILMSAISGILLTYVFIALEYLFGVKTAPTFRLMIQIFGALALVLGETFTLYYQIPWWDTFLHFTSGILFAFVGSYLLDAVFKNSQIQHRNIVLIVGGCLICLSVGFIWEIFEFSMDSLFGLNMQKAIPEIEGIFNGGNTFEELIGSSELIADFYKSPEGYRYALMDTMQDLTVCFLGVLLFGLISSILVKFKENAFEGKIAFTKENIIYRIKNRN